MFTYYGRKTAIARLYPSPQYGHIIEPFAGSAAYSLYADYWKNQVDLYDTDPHVACIWDYLIKEATPERILKLPDLEPGESLLQPKFTTDLAEAEMWLIIFCASANGGTYRPRKATPLANWNRRKPQIARQLHKVKHWVFHKASYETAPDIEATWFIDPPYADKGYKYRKNGSGLDYTALGQWCRERKGLTIVCENEGADWLPFEHLHELQSITTINTEVYWVNQPESRKIIHQKAFMFTEEK